MEKYGGAASSNQIASLLHPGAVGIISSIVSFHFYIYFYSYHLFRACI